MSDYTRDSLIRLLMRRDGLDRFDAVDLVDECQAQLDDCLANAPDSDPFEVIFELERIVADELGLEPDYLNCFNIF